MSLNAVKLLERQKRDGNLCWTFNIASAEEMTALGKVFAQAVLPAVSTFKSTGRFKRLFHKIWRRPVDTSPKHFLRIGLDSRDVYGVFKRGAGKTTFAHGFLKAVKDRKRIETPEVVESVEQNVWQSHAAGTIRHYDCKMTWFKEAPPSYRDNKKDFGDSKALIDLVEHPQDDKHDKRFHLLFVFRKAANDNKNKESKENEREVTLVMTPEVANLPAVQEFMEKSKAWQSMLGDSTGVAVSRPSRSGLKANL